jgi:hypothetical protein
MTARLQDAPGGIPSTSPGGLQHREDEPPASISGNVKAGPSGKPVKMVISIKWP